MPCTFKKTVEAILDTDNQLLVQLKANHPTLQQAIQAHCRHHPPEDQHTRGEVGHRSRLAQRSVRLWSLPAGTGTHPWHDHFPVVIEVTRHTECFNTARKGWVPRQEQPRTK